VIPTWAEKYRERPEAKIRTDSPAVAAALLVPIGQILTELGVEVPEGLGLQSWKTWCPFGGEHPDSGSQRDMRVYESSNSVYCFRMHGYMTSVRLISIRYGMSAEQAARHILSTRGGIPTKSWRARRDELLAERAAPTEPPVSIASVVEALSVSMNREPGWASKQYDGAVLAVMDEVLAELDSVTEGDLEQLREWYDAARRRLFETAFSQVI
jgi:hypothetical protein